MFPPTAQNRREQIASLRHSYGRKRKIQDRLLATAIVTPVWLGAAWSLMITTGIAHRNWWHLMPPMNYTTALILTAVPLAVSALLRLGYEYLFGSGR